MFKNFLQNIAGHATTAAVKYPDTYGVNEVPQQTGFKALLGSLISSFSSGNAGFPGAGGGFGGAQGTLQAYKSFQGQLAGQSFPGGINNKVIKKQLALAPGSVMLPPIDQTSPQSLQNAFGGAIPPQLPFPGQNPMQGFAGASGGFSGPASGSLLSGPLTPFGQFPIGPNGLQSGNKLQLLMFPIMTLFSVVKSLFNFRRTVGFLQPIKIDRNKFAYYSNQKEFEDFKRQEGSFDEYYPEQEDDHFEPGKLG